ncbi:unnamed protein product [Calypogeia fissa]
MFGSRVACCCSPREHLMLSTGGLQPTSAPNCSSSSSSSYSVASTAATSLVVAENYVTSVCFFPSAAAASKKSLGPDIKTSQLWRPVSLARRATFDQGSVLQCPPSLLSIRASSQPRQRFVKACGRVSPSLPFFRGSQFPSGIRVCRVLNADANPEVEVNVDLEESGHSPEVELRTECEEKNVPLQELQQQKQQKKLWNRIVFGAGIGAALLGIVLAGGWVFTLALSWSIWVGTGEYFELVRSKGNVASGLTPPPLVAAKVCAAICSLMPIMTLYFGGRMGVIVTTSAFGLAAVLVLQKGPRFSQLTSAIFGLIYCGYLPSFWIKLRCGLSVPALNTRVAAGWPVLFGGQAHWTVGLVATIVSCSAIVAADTFSFLGGKTFGKTPLIAISPKKTLEGAAAGLSCTIGVTILLSKLLQWPSSTPSAAVLAVLVFMASLFGDLTESMMKRDAGVKDSGHLIPGHGGILDRVDSYIFTGALVYSFVKIGLPLFGV